MTGTRPLNICALLALFWAVIHVTALPAQGEEVSSRHVTRLAEVGMRFTDAYAANLVCSPTRYAILTGKHPTRGQ